MVCPGLAPAVAVEVAGMGVTCNAVLPGSVRTRSAERKVAEEARLAGTAIEQAWAARAARTTGGRLVTSEEVAAAIAFLASEEARGVNGQAVNEGPCPVKITWAAWRGGPRASRP